ncbi:MULTISPECIES: protein-glutamate O-methyltransferase CheR [Anaeromyxobacter]|uniref:CheR family methyltransferase n=1 Tax=Anaeromyxobacter TaxID=161492 RepID=UPI001F57C245|nr:MULTISPECIES: protein-glutamate O-methyltransferase CheR [unclassified Anaeromyxobacter]
MTVHAERRARQVAGAGSVPAVVAPAVSAVTDGEFELFQRLIHAEAGIWLAPVKKALLVGRLARRLRELGLTSYHAYYERVRGDAAEKVRMLDAICTNETHFFREPRHFEFLREQVFPALREEAEAGRRARRIRVWSAACSSGEEPYSLAMSLLDAFPSGWELEILATDLSTRILDRARAAVWPIDKASEIPEAYLKAYMLRGVGSQEGLMKAGPEIRARVRFDRVNLNGDAWPDARFDLVFCRNVLIYFERKAKERVVERLIDRLEPGGHLFLGHAESLGGLTTRARAAMPTVYTLPPPARSA